MTSVPATPGPARIGAKIAPVSSGQRRLWVIDASAPGSAMYNVPLFVRWSEPAQAAALSTALSAVAARHEALRSTYAIEGGELVQVVGDPAEITVETVDLSHEADAERLLGASAEQRARRPFRLATDRPLRCTLWPGLPGGDAMLLVVHHIAIDGWSVAILMDDLAAAYAAAVGGRVPRLAPVPVQYADFAAWDRARLADPQLRAELTDRAAALAQVPAGLELAGRLAPEAAPGGGSRGGQHAFEVPGPVWSAAGQLARALRATPYVVLLSAFQVVLWRWSGGTEFVLGTLAANRPHPDLEEVVGFFVNTVPLRCEVRPGWTFAEACRHARREAYRSLSDQRFPFDELTREVAAARGQVRGQLVDVAFALQSRPAGRGPATAPWTPPSELPTGTAKFEVLLTLEEGSGRLAGAVEVDLDRYPAETGQRLADDFLTVLARAVADPACLLDELLGSAGDEPRLSAPRGTHGTRPTATDARAPERTASPGELTAGRREAADLFISALATMDRARDAGWESELDAQSNFFALGGHSLLAVMMLTEAQRRHRISLPVRSFLADPTVAGLGRLLASQEPRRADQDTGGGGGGGGGGARAGDQQASSVQRRLWVMDRIPALRSAYILPTLIELAGPVDQPALRRSLAAVLARHPVLRSRFRLDRERRALVYRTDGPPPEVTVTQAAGWPADRVEEYLSERLWLPFDLTTDAPAHGEIVIGADRSVVLIRAHHLVLDGWSQRVLADELAASYRAGSGGREPELADPAALEAGSAAAGPPDGWGSRVAARVSELAGAPTDVALPRDRDRGGVQSTLAATWSVRLGATVANALRAAAGEVGGTTFQATAALLGAALARHSDQRDYLFVFPWAGRETAQAHSAVGMFVNTVPLRVDLRGGPTWRELLRRVHTASLDSLRDADLPFDLLAAALHPARDLSAPAVTPVYLAATDGDPLPPDFGPGRPARYLPLRPLHVKYELEVTAVETAADIEIRASYAQSLFDEKTIAGLFDTLLAGAAELAADPGTPACRES
jgi:non-ribosomal peptide synthetase component F